MEEEEVIEGFRSYWQPGLYQIESAGWKFVGSKEPMIESKKWVALWQYSGVDPKAKELRHRDPVVG
jgi:hypothetical protein